MNETRCSRGVSMSVQAMDRSYVGVSMNVQPKSFIEAPPLRRRATETIKRLGTPIQIIRESRVVDSHAILAPLQRISSPQTLAVIRTAWFIPGDDVQGGDYVYDINRSTYFIFLAQNEYISEGEIVGMRSIIARCNRVAALYRYVDKPTGVGGVTQVFEQIEKNFPLAIEFIRPGIQAGEPGFFRSSTHRCFLPSYLGIEVMDRIKVGEDFLKVDAIDTVSFDNLLHCTLTRDRRPDEDS